ncbi:MAG: glycosyltransferase [Planctomycetes bacterium]|nr:glycosyltransferase [Planctomycetota bacterium]MCW8137399.1 glycosyltransferase family 1 protein [Planctomycetota bacterium]
MALNVLHLVAEEVELASAARLQRAETSVGLRPRIVGPPANYETSEIRIERLCRWNAETLEQELDPSVSRIDLVVAHGWWSTPAAERLAARRGVPLVLVGRSSAQEAEEKEIASWAAAHADWIMEPLTEDAEPAAVGRRALAVYQETLARRTATTDAPAPPRPYQVLVRAEDLAHSLVDFLLVGLPRVAIMKGASQEAWSEACARSDTAVMASGAGSAQAAEAALACGCLPLVVGVTTSVDRRVVCTAPAALAQELARWLSEPEERARRLSRSRTSPPAPPEALRSRTRPLRVVLSHGGLVAEELRHSLAPLGWELRSLLGPGGDPLASADFLVVLPYGDPHGALHAVRRARRMGVPTAFWNVEDPRYYFDRELGPPVLAAAQEATLAFSTTLQLAAEYRAHGVELRNLPNYGRTFFFVAEPLPEHERAIDVLFLGTLTPERQEFLQEYRSALGQRWNLVVRDDVRDPSMLRGLVSTARLGLSIGTMTDSVRAGGARVRGEGVTERVFDYPLAGTPVLSDRRGHLADVLTEGEDVFVFEDVRDATQRTKDLLADADARACAVGTARRKVLQRHLGRHRLHTIAGALADQDGASGLLRDAVERARAHLEDPMVLA